MDHDLTFEHAPDNFSLEDFLESFFSPGARGLTSQSSPHGGTAIPFTVLQRALQRRDMAAGTLSTGGALVTTAGVDSTINPYLRARSVLGRAGAQIVTGLRADTALPVALSDLTAQWLPEYGQAAADDFATGQALLNPHRVSVVVTVSDLLMRQSKPDLAAFLADQIVSKIQSAVDIAGILGIGGTQPVGLINTKGLPTLPWGGAPTWANTLLFEEALGNNNISDVGNPCWLHSPATRALFKGTQRASGSSLYLEDDFNRIAGYRSLATTTLNTANANDRIIFGDFSKFFIGYFGNSFYLTRNPYTLSKTGEVQFTCHAYVDCGTPYPAQAFVASSDSSIQ